MTGKSLTSHLFACGAMSLMLTMPWSAGVAASIIERHNELRDLEADMLSMVCNDVEIEIRCQAEQTELPTFAQTSMPEAFGKGKGQRSSMYGYVTPTLILIETWTSGRYTSSTRTTRRDYTHKE